ncbi:sulfate ABC transporter substrate-binding protein [Ursidibacter arcticus]
MKRILLIFLFGISSLSIGIKNAEAKEQMLLVAYDVIRDYYKQYLPIYINQHGNLNVGLSFGGASKQAIAVQNGLPADVVTLNQRNDIELLVKNGWVSPDWQQKYPNNAVPFYTTIVLLVRKGNPKQIRDWDDLAKDGVKVVFANPKTSGNGRYAYLSLFGFARKHYADEQQGNVFLQKVLQNVPLFDAGARAATITFVQREIGDVLIAPENEASLAAKALGEDKFEVIYPSYSAAAEVLVAEVDKNTRKHKNQNLTQDFIASLWQETAQQVAAENYFRPTHPSVLKAFAQRFPEVETFNVNELFGDWKQITKQHFADGALFDQLYLGEKK